MTEWKKALDTKDEKIALKRWIAEDARFEAAVEIANKYLNEETFTPSETISEAKRLLVEKNIHPEMAPSLTAKATKEEIAEFPFKVAEWNNHLSDMRDVLIGAIHDKYIDSEQIEIDYNEGRLFQSDYKTPYRETQTSDPLIAAYDMLDGNLETTATSTWDDAVELYIKINKQEKKRERVKSERWEAKTRQLLQRFSRAFNGSKLAVADLDKGKIRDWLYSTYPTAPTRNRYINTFSAVVNNWNRENKNGVFNPFSGLANKQLEKEEAVDRRSFTPEEWHQFLNHVQELSDLELRIIGLLMIFTGCRTSEAAGLETKDVKLSGNMPHVVFATNKIRRMDKKGLERAVPLLSPVLDAMREYEAPEQREAPYFRKYGHTKGFDLASTKLRHIVNEKMGLKEDPSVVPYSCRHTIIDRGDIASDVAQARTEYIVGHRTAQSSRIHQNYGTKTPPSILYQDMIKIFEVLLGNKSCGGQANQPVGRIGQI